MPCACSVCGERCDCDEIVCSRCLVEILEKNSNDAITEFIKQRISDD